MFGRLILYGALALAIGIVVVSACGPQPGKSFTEEQGALLKLLSLRL